VEQRIEGSKWGKWVREREREDVDCVFELHAPILRVERLSSEWVSKDEEEEEEEDKKRGRRQLVDTCFLNTTFGWGFFCFCSNERRPKWVEIAKQKPGTKKATKKKMEREREREREDKEGYHVWNERWAGETIKCVIKEDEENRRCEWSECRKTMMSTHAEREEEEEDEDEKRRVITMETGEPRDSDIEGVQRERERERGRQRAENKTQDGGREEDLNVDAGMKMIGRW
jgi:hypothetical protein